MQLSPGHYFVTGTDTDIGKTWVTCRLLERAVLLGQTAYALKPVAAGCRQVGQEWVNDDALTLMKHANVALPYAAVNPVALKAPAAPHLVAQEEGRVIDIDWLADQIQRTIRGYAADRVFIEGAGGWHVPLSDESRWTDLVKRLDVGVILVVGMKLGCLNHALLTAEAIQQGGHSLVGWIANDLGNPMPRLADNIRTLEQRIKAPRLLL